jgi:F-box protein 18 (helicase)
MADSAIKLTTEQEQVINYNLLEGQALVVEAGAGTGKTTCFLKFSQAHPEDKILYLCFNNKSAKEAKQKYKELGVHNTKTSTVHGLAYKTKRYYTELGKFSKKILPRDLERKFGYDIATSCLVLKTIKKFCESADQEIKRGHTPALEGIDQYSAIASESGIEKAQDEIKLKAERVWKSMVSPRSDMPISYDHYLKIFQLNKPILDFSYILLDEAQDSNPVTLALLEAQKSRVKTILIGDKNQAIYGWRGAEDALGRYKAVATLPLTQSFRFGKKIANVANHILEKYHKSTGRIQGQDKEDLIGKISDSEAKTFISRTNARLFDEALKLCRMGKSYHFLGTTKEENWNPSKLYKLNDLKDVYRLYIGETKLIENPYIKIYQDYNKLKLAAFGTPSKHKDNKISSEGDTELQFLCRLIEKYKHSIPNIVQTIISNSKGPNETALGPIVTLTTSHRAKGLEWENVELADDFAKLIISDKMPSKEYREEINLIYVAVTRAKSKLSLSKDLVLSLEKEESRDKENLKQTKIQQEVEALEI